MTLRNLVLCAAVLPLLARLPATTQLVYEFPPLAGTPQDKTTRTRGEVEKTARRVVAAYADKNLAGYGILDVTKAPYSARGDGRTDNTAALQQAVKDARDAQLVAWFPAGVYLVRGTIQCVQGTIVPDKSADAPAAGPKPYSGERPRYPCILQGASGRSRAVLKLAPNSPGFGDPQRPRPLVLIWARGRENPTGIQPNISFNQRVIGLDLDLGGNAGAIGIDMQGAQGTGVEDMRIDARGAFIGLRGLQGSGGSTFDLTVKGGRFGVYAVGIGPYAGVTGSQPSPLLAHPTLIGQTVAAIQFAGRGPLTVVGATVRGRGIVCDGGRNLNNAGLSVIDSSIEIDSGAPAIASNRPVYMANTWVRGAAIVAALDGKPALEGRKAAWTHVREYAGAPPGPFPIWVDGRRRDDFRDVVSSATAPPAALGARHALPKTLPRWDQPGVANVREAPYLAKGDGLSDDTAALERALREHDAVFLPKGVYMIRRPLRLGARTRLFGVATTFTRVAPLPDAAAFSDASDAQPMIDTPDDAAADTVVSRLLIETAALPGARSLRWRAGRNSAVVDLRYGRPPSVLIEGNGGGRWFDFHIGNPRSVPPDYRLLMARHTREPLTFYMYDPEAARSSVMTEFEDVRNVTMYALKAETHEIGNPDSGTRPILLARDSNNFRIHGAGGLMGVDAGSVPYVFRFENCADFLVANEGHQPFKYHSDPSGWSMLVDVGKSGEVKTPGTEFFVLYKRGVDGELF